MNQNPQQLMDGMAAKNREMSMKIDEFSTLAENMANAEREYNVLFSRKLLELKADGIAVTTSKELAKGDSRVADALFAFRVAEAVYKACDKKIRSLDTAIDTYRSMLSWMKQEYGKQA